MRPAAAARAATRTAAVPIQPGTSADGAVQRLAGALLLLAARRYPEPVRSELALEWTGELHAIVHDDDRSRLYRDYWALLYGGSLAVTAALFSRTYRAGVATSGSTRFKNGLIAAVLVAIAVVAATAFIRAGAAAARANAYARAAAAARANAYAAGTAYTRASGEAAIAAQNADFFTHSSVEIVEFNTSTGRLTPRKANELDFARIRAYAAARASHARVTARTRASASARATATAARATAATASVRDAVKVALAAAVVFAGAIAFVAVKIRRARRRLRS